MRATICLLCLGSCALAQYSQQAKLVGSGGVGDTCQGEAISISADGNTAVVGGPCDYNYTGSTWVFTRSNGVWSQQGKKLVGIGASGSDQQGGGVAI